MASGVVRAYVQLAEGLADLARERVRAAVASMAEQQRRTSDSAEMSAMTELRAQVERLSVRVDRLSAGSAAGQTPATRAVAKTAPTRKATRKATAKKATAKKATQ